MVVVVLGQALCSDTYALIIFTLVGILVDGDEDTPQYGFITKKSIGRQIISRAFWYSVRAFTYIAWR